MTVARAILIALVALVCAPARAAPVRIDYPNGHGSGFTVGDGMIVTAAHLVTDAMGDVMTVVTEGGAKASATVLWANYELDVAAIRVTDKDWQEPAQSTLNCDRDPSIGADVELIGNPWSTSFVHTWGRVGSVVGSGSSGASTWPVSYLIDATIAHGESGGPVISDGKVVGELVGIEVQDDSFGFVVPATTVCKLLEGNKAPG